MDEDQRRHQPHEHRRVAQGLQRRAHVEARHLRRRGPQPHPVPPPVHGDGRQAQLRHRAHAHRGAERRDDRRPFVQLRRPARAHGAAGRDREERPHRGPHPRQQRRQQPGRRAPLYHPAHAPVDHDDQPRPQPHFASRRADDPLRDPGQPADHQAVARGHGAAARDALAHRPAAAPQPNQDRAAASGRGRGGQGRRGQDDDWLSGG
mmetsp:Transcript_31525/g.97396  ORF Transcript_31525/g.97396 Transcript_31525/m.97396 type:complete len:206 (+) Transcript_31525:1145-1762(+)